MSAKDKLVLFDTVKNIKIKGEFKGSILSKCRDEFNSIIFSDNIKISESGEISIKEGLKVGFKEEGHKKVAFSTQGDFMWADPKDSALEYSLLIPNNIMELYDEVQLSDAFPYTINMLHTAGLYLKENHFSIDHRDFFKGEILKNPVSVIFGGILIADRIVIDHRGDPFFYNCLIIGRDKTEDLNITYEPLFNVKMDDEVVLSIIILGIEDLRIGTAKV